jgi:hypothetical protein
MRESTFIVTEGVTLSGKRTVLGQHFGKDGKTVADEAIF